TPVRVTAALFPCFGQPSRRPAPGTAWPPETWAGRSEPQLAAQPLPEGFADRHEPFFACHPSFPPYRVSDRDDPQIVGPPTLLLVRGVRGKLPLAGGHLP